MGSTHLDRRSFELNYENNMLFCDTDVTHEIITRQKEFLKDSRNISLEEVEKWNIPQKLYNNVLSTIGPIL